MPNISQILRTRSRDKGIRQDILEKDYALSYLLTAIMDTPDLGNQLVVKGGTALRKLYYPGYRFSEDLDYSTVQVGSPTDVFGAMGGAIQRMTNLLLERGPFDVQFEPLILPMPHPGKQVAFLVRVRFPGQRQSFCRLKIEITVDEPILMPAEHRWLIHDFDEPLTRSIPVYALAEIVSEKLRALLQSHQRLAERGWGASRVCRDYYDLWWILRQEGRFNGQVPDLALRKCAVRQVTFVSPEQFIEAGLLEVARSEWQQQLLPFVPDAPAAERVIEEVTPLILSLWK